MCKILKIFFFSITATTAPAPSPPGRVVAVSGGRGNLLVAWTQPNRPNGRLLQYTVRHHHHHLQERHDRYHYYPYDHHHNYDYPSPRDVIFTMCSHFHLGTNTSSWIYSKSTGIMSQENRGAGVLAASKTWKGDSTKGTEGLRDIRDVDNIWELRDFPFLRSPLSRSCRSSQWTSSMIMMMESQHCSGVIIANITNIIYAAQVSADVTFLSIPGLPTSRT